MTKPFFRRADDEQMLGRGVYGAAEALRLVNFRRQAGRGNRLSRQTLSRWLRGYDFVVGEVAHRSEPLWTPDYVNDDGLLEISFRDLIELRFVKTFRDIGLGLQTIRRCFERAVEAVKDPRPFSTHKFRTDGKSIFLDITDGMHEGELLDLRSRPNVFRTVIAPSLKDLEFDDAELARWFPLGELRRQVVLDPTRSFGRPIVIAGGVPTEILVEAVAVEGSRERVARLYEVPLPAVLDAVDFEQKLAA